MVLAEDNKKLVSIVVPVYNVEMYLPACLDSLIGQTYGTIEILLVDDGSTDESGKICDAYAAKDNRIRVCHKKNQGVSSARNTGIEMAGGEYLIFVDPDDCVHRQMVELYVSCIGKTGTLLCDITVRMDELKSCYDRADEGKMEEVPYENFMQLFYRDYINPPFNKFYKTELIKENNIRFPENMSLGEDLLFNLDYFRHADRVCRIIHIPLYYYRNDRIGSLSNSYRKDLFELQLNMFGSLKEFLEETNVWNEKNAEIYYRMYWDRLYLTARMCRAYEKEHPEERRLPELLKDPVWKEVWEECRKRGQITWKRRIKAASLNLWRVLK